MFYKNEERSINLGKIGRNKSLIFYEMDIGCFYGKRMLFSNKQTNKKLHNGLISVNGARTAIGGFFTEIYFTQI